MRELTPEGQVSADAAWERDINEPMTEAELDGWDATAQRCRGDVNAYYVARLIREVRRLRGKVRETVELVSAVTADGGQRSGSDERR